MKPITCTTTHYPINITSLPGIWTKNGLIPPTDAEIIDRHRRTREGYDSLGLRAFPNYNLIIMQYILITWWLQLLDRLGHYVIRPWEIEQVPVMNNNIMTLVYTYAKLSINNPPDIFCKLAYTVRIIVWIPSWLAWTPELRGRDQSLLLPSQPTALYGTSNQEVPTPFETSTRYILWDSGCTYSINTYFDIYTQYTPLEKGDNTEGNITRGIINPKGEGTVILYLKDDTGKLHNIIFKNAYYFPGAPKILISPQKRAQDRGVFMSLSTVTVTR